MLPLVLPRVLLKRSSGGRISQRNRVLLNWLANQPEEEADQPEEALLHPSTEREAVGALSPMWALLKRYRVIASGGRE